MKTNLLFLFAILLCCAVDADAQIKFRKSYGGNSNPYATCYVVNTYNGDYVIVGNTASYGAGGNDLYLARTDPSGNLLWTKTYGGPSFEIATNIAQTSDSGFVISGISSSFGAGGDDFYIIKTDRNGDTLWTKTYGSTHNDEVRNVNPTIDGGLIISGIGGNIGGYTQFLKTNSNGDTLWTKCYDAGNPLYVMQNPDSSYIICGSVYVSGGNGPDLTLMKMDSLGNILWENTYGGTGSEAGYQVIPANDGGYIIMGFTTSYGAGNEDVYVVKTDSIGGLLWSKTYGTSTIDKGRSIVSTGNGYVLVAETWLNLSTQEGLLINIDNQGNLRRASNYYYTGLSGSLQKTADGGFIYSSNAADLYLVKTDSMGFSGCADSLITTVLVDTAATMVAGYPFQSLTDVLQIGSPHTLVSSGGIATTICFTTGLKNEGAPTSTIIVFPNPAANELTVAVDKSFGQVKSLAIYNMFGQMLFTTPQTQSINVTNLPAGLYLVKVINTGGVILTERFQKM